MRAPFVFGEVAIGTTRYTVTDCLVPDALRVWQGEPGNGAPVMTLVDVSTRPRPEFHREWLLAPMSDRRALVERTVRLHRSRTDVFFTDH